MRAAAAAISARSNSLSEEKKEGIACVHLVGNAPPSGKIA
jgi:hypothetical protein